MNETIDLRWKELCAEVRLRQRGLKGEWDIPNDILARLFFARAHRVPLVITRKVENDGQGCDKKIEEKDQAP